MAFDDVFRIIASQSITVVSAGVAAAASTTVLGSQTYWVALSFPGSTSSTGGCRFVIGDEAASAVSSTQSALLPANWIGYFKCSPGQRVYAKSNDAGTPSLTVMELSK